MWEVVAVLYGYLSFEAQRYTMVLDCTSYEFEVYFLKFKDLRRTVALECYANKIAREALR